MSYRYGRGPSRQVDIRQYIGRRRKPKFVARFAQRRGVVVNRDVGRFGRRKFNKYAAYAMNPATQGLLGIEKKFLDIPFGATALTAPTDASGGAIAPSGVVTGCYSAPAQGDGPTNRDGNKIVVTECGFQGIITVPAQSGVATADTSCAVFMCIVQDMQTNGAVLTSQSVWTNPIAAANAATSLFRNMSFTSRFRILKMKKFDLRIPSITFNGATLEQFGFTKSFNMKYKGKMPVTFTTASTTADIANVTDNSIQLIAFCTNTSLVPSIVGNCRTRFYG